MLSKLRDMMIRKSREYRSLLHKYNRDSKQGQAWCAAICLLEEMLGRFMNSKMKGGA